MRMRNFSQTYGDGPGFTVFVRTLLADTLEIEGRPSAARKYHRSNQAVLRF